MYTSLELDKMKRDKFTIGDQVKEEFSFRLNPNCIRINMSLKNSIFICYYHSFLEKIWKSKKSGAMNLIFFNKVISSLIRKNPEKLGFVTRGWYLYGVDVMRPQTQQIMSSTSMEELTGATGFTKLEVEEFNSQVEKIAKEYNPDETNFFWEEKQYKEFNNTTYQAKLNLQKKFKNGTIQEIDKALSKLSFELIKQKPILSSGTETLQVFIDFSKKVILSNNYKIPNKKEIIDVFNFCWKAYAKVELYTTVEGMDAEKVKINSPQRIKIAINNARKELPRIVGQIKLSNETLIKPSQIQKEYLKHINEI